MSDHGAVATGPPVLHVFGCGRAARVIARWLREANQVTIGQVVNRSIESSRRAVDFIGEGRAVAAMDPAPGWLLLGLPDQVLLGSNSMLQARHGSMPAALPELVFHLSGSLGSAVLKAFAVPAASVHPVRAFASPETALKAMPGTPCVAEGDRPALDRLRPAVIAAGGDWLELGQTDKARYHAATVVASNGLVALTHLARGLARSAGLPPEQAARLLAHLQRGTLDNLSMGTSADALTGPVERADAIAMARLLRAVDASGEDRSGLFRALGRATLALAVRKRGARHEDEAMAALFADDATNRSD